MGSTIIRTSPLLGNLSGEGPYKEKKFVAASPRLGGAKIELIKYKRTKKSAKKSAEVNRKGSETVAGQSCAKAVRIENVKSETEILDEIVVLDQRILKLAEERKKTWISLRKRLAATELFHQLRKKRSLLASQL